MLDLSGRGGATFPRSARIYSVAARECFRRSRCGNHGAFLLKAEDADLTAVVGGNRIICAVHNHNWWRAAVLRTGRVVGVGRSAPKIAILAAGPGDRVANVIANWPPLE